MTPAEMAEMLRVVLDTVEHVADVSIITGEPDAVGVSTVDGDYFILKVEVA